MFMQICLFCFFYIITTLVILVQSWSFGSTSSIFFFLLREHSFSWQASWTGSWFLLISKGPTQQKPKQSFLCSRQKKPIKIHLIWNTDMATVTSCANALSKIIPSSSLSRICEKYNLFIMSAIRTRKTKVRKNTMISKELDCVPKYHRLKPTWPPIAQLVEHLTSERKVAVSIPVPEFATKSRFAGQGTLFTVGNLIVKKRLLMVYGILYEALWLCRAAETLRGVAGENVSEQCPVQCIF
jgi:hypothetical protein